MSVSIPAILLSGATTNEMAADILVRYRKDGDTDWLYWPATPVSLGYVLITGVAPAPIEYNVEIAYRSVLGVVSSVWTSMGNVTPGDYIAGGIDGQGDLATLDDVDTPQIVLNAATNLAGAVTSGPTSVAYRGASRTVWTKVDEIVFTASGEGEVFVQWNGIVQWNQNSSTECPLLMTNDGNPPTTFNVAGFWYFSNYVAFAPAKGNQNALSCGYALTDMRAYTAGSVTIQIWAQAENNTGSLPVVTDGASFFVFEAKR